MRPSTPLTLAALSLPLALSAQTMQAPDIRQQPTLYVVPYAHLDTQWRWDFPQTISENLLKTMRVNFDYMDKYPHYVFNWSGSNRYRLMKEYFPSDYARMKTYVARGQWFPAGSSVEEGDVNLPSAESIFRQVLLGNTYFRGEFGKASAEYMLPDCFGFPASLPTILHHAGVKGFSTQKLNSDWQPAPMVGGPSSPEQTPSGIPFNVGLWQGPDGSTIIAALNPGSYIGSIRSDLSQPTNLDIKPEHGHAEQNWPHRIDIDGKLTGIFADYHYIGTGDIGGATDEQSVKLLEAIVTHSEAVIPPPYGTSTQPVRLGEGPVHVVSAAADQLFLDLKPDMQTHLPRYQGDLELINHSAGSLTSQALHKRWNRKNEILAGAAEEASVAAAWLGGLPYPQQRLNDAWTLVLGGQFHDTAAGTANPRAYEFAQNDDVIALNQFAGVLTSAIQSVASQTDTQGEGAPIVVFNSLNIDRTDIAEVDTASIFPTAPPKSIRVAGPDGQPVPAQIESGKILFLAHTPSAGFAVFHIQRATSSAPSPELKATSDTLENARYKVTLNPAGDIASIFDKQLSRELLASPLRLALSTDAPLHWPAWNMDFDQEQAAPRAFVSGPAKLRIVERGPARIAIEVSRETEGSTFTQTVRLSAGDPGNRVEIGESIDWHGLSSNLKAVFSLTASNPLATYNWEVGTVQRPNAFDRQFEVGSHHWIDLTDTSNTFGATILTDVKNASDKRDDHTLRLTLLRTPGFPAADPAHPQNRDYSDQLNQDWGLHDILFGIAGHASDCQHSDTAWQAYRLSTPLEAFVTTPHPGPLGNSFSLIQVSDPHVRVLALKKAELTSETILRLVEMNGAPADHVSVRLAAPVTSVRELNAQELDPADSTSAPATLTTGTLETSFKPFQPRTFALTLGKAPAPAHVITSQPVALAYDLATASNDDTPSVGGFDAAGNALPAEMLPPSLKYSGVTFQLAPAATGKPNALVARGQTIALPAGNFNQVWILAASSEGDRTATFHLDTKAVPLTIQSWGGFIGQGDTRVWKPAPANIRSDWSISANHAAWDLTSTGTPDWSPRYPEDYISLTPGFIKPAALAWYASHHHTAAGLNQPYQYSYLFAYPISLPPGTRQLTLPADEKIRILAISVAEGQPATHPAHPLYDTLLAHSGASAR